MRKHRFSGPESYAIWKYHGQRCYWCREPLRYVDATVDHVLPESLIEAPERFMAVKRDFGLPATFDLNSYQNWLPACSRCNRDKSSTIFSAVPVMLQQLRMLARAAPAVRALEERLRQRKKFDDLLAQLRVAVDLGTVDLDEIQAMFADPELKDDPDVSILEAEVRLNIGLGRWKVRETRGNVAFVSDGRVSGVTSAVPVPDASWICPSCGFHGPWNGVICMSCGMRSDPGD